MFNSTGYLQTSWPRFFLASSVFLPSSLALLNRTWSLPAFIPRQVIHDNNLLPLLVAPWSGPQSFSSFFSRLLQIVVLLQLPRSSSVFYLQYCYPLWVLVALARTLVGWLLSRSVGWAYPKLFRHWALYEPTSGFGSTLTMLFIWQSTGSLAFDNPTDPTTSRTGMTVFDPIRRNYGYLPFILLYTATSCWLENAPWTYGIILLSGMGILVARRLFFRLLPSQAVKYPRSPIPIIIGEPSSERLSALVTGKLGLRSTLILIIFSLFLMELPYNLASVFRISTPTPMPTSPSSSNPLLDIMILTYPRPNTVAHAAIMKATIDTYLPTLNDQIRLSVYTQAKEHRALEEVLKIIPNNNISHYVNQNTYIGAVDGHYLHLSEAFRWISERRPDHEVAEWVMLVEDDFPLCAGDVGEDALRQVLTILEASRPTGDALALPRRRGGFIGTGGSGLIIHRSLLPILQLVLRVHAEAPSKLPSVTDRRAPDLIVQDCILGKDPLCLQPVGNVCQNQGGNPAPCGLVITSRMVMDHIGGMLSTNTIKAKNSDKWRCGWRHPFHGTAGVEVVVVDW